MQNLMESSRRAGKGLAGGRQRMPLFVKYTRVPV
jgi:hypothetical protein